MTTDCSWNYHEHYKRSFVILWVSWCQDKCFWKRFTCTTLHRGAFFQFLFRWIHYCHSSKSTERKVTKFTSVHCTVFCQSSFWWISYYGSNKSTWKETGKLHLCALQELFRNFKVMHFFPSEIFEGIQKPSTSSIRITLFAICIQHLKVTLYSKLLWLYSILYNSGDDIKILIGNIDGFWIHFELPKWIPIVRK